MSLKLPNRCFVSHSYLDKAGIKSLKKSLPPTVESVIFPREDPDPETAVSDEIVPEILNCNGLIYLEGGHSADSSWVRFERDFALRAKKKVFSYDPQEKKFSRDSGKPLDLRVQVFVSETHSKARAKKMLKWMRQNRYFDITDIKQARRVKDVPDIFEGLAQAQKLVVWLLDETAADLAGFPWQLEYDEVELDVPDGWWPPPTIYARIDPKWEPPSDPDPEARVILAEMYPFLRHWLDLVEDAGADGLNWNRVDDLIIRITLRLADLPAIDEEYL